MNTSKNAVLYLRVSTEEQVDNYSLDTQESICSNEAQKQGYTVTKIFREEGKSAKTITGRPVLIQLIEYCRKNGRDVQALIFYKTDRLSRQMTDYLIIKEKLNNLGIRLISATEPIDDSPMGKFIGNFYAGIAQLDNEIKSERVKNGMHARFQSGLITSGTVPLGYSRHQGYVFKDKKTWDKVKEAWLLMSTGTKSLREMAKIMNSWGLRTTRNNISYLLRPQTVNNIFRSKFYIGKLVSKRYREEVQGQHEPMISKELFEIVQSVLNGRLTRVTIKPLLSERITENSDFPLRRVIRCGHCGLAFTGSWSHGRNSKYAYYRCYKAEICRSSSVQAENIHTSLIELLSQLHITNTGKQILETLAEREYKKRLSVLTLRKIKQEQTLKKLKTMRNNLIQKHLSGIYTDEIFSEQNEMISQRIKGIEKSQDTYLIQKYSINIINERLVRDFDDLPSMFINYKFDRKKTLLSIFFPYGLIWNYPGLNFSKLSFLFKV